MILDLFCALTFAFYVGIAFYVFTSASLNGWQHVGDTFDKVCNLIHPIDSNYYGEE